MIEPIYIHRPLTHIGGARLGAYSDALGLQNIVLDMHATLAYSRDAVDWDLPEFQTDPRGLTVDGGERKIGRFGDAVVLEFESRAFSQRWAQFIMAGASWDHEEYRPHVTLAYDPDVDVESLQASTLPLPFLGEFREMLFEDFEPLTTGAIG